MAATKRRVKRKATKDTEIRFRGSEVDVLRLEALQQAYELNGSAVLRRLIAEAHKALGVA